MTQGSRWIKVPRSLTESELDVRPYLTCDHTFSTPASLDPADTLTLSET